MKTKLYSTAQAAQYLHVPYGTWKYHVFIKSFVTPMLKGKTAVFTRRMLDAYASGERDVEPQATELAEIYDTKEAAEYCGMAVEAFKFHVFAAKTVRSTRIGHTRLYVRADLDAFLNEKRGPGRPSGVSQ